MEQLATIENAPAAAPKQPASDTTFRFSFHGTGTAFFALVLKNMVLTVLTLGIYVPWAKTERRKYLWQNIELQGHRLRYHGTGKELFIGYLKVVAAYLLFVGMPVLIGKLAGQIAVAVTQVLLALLLVPVIPYAIWGSRRYLLSRTSWRGVHLRLGDGAHAYAKTFLLGYLLTLVTLGLYGPVWMNRMYRITTGHTALGTRSFEYRGADRDAWRIAVKGVLLSILTLGIYSFWYRAEMLRFQMSNTWFEGARGESSITGGELFGLTVVQLLALTFSLGLAFPWITCYSLQFVLQRISFTGSVDLASIYQAQSRGDASADGLADVLDLGVGL